MRLAQPLAPIALITALLAAGCGSSDSPESTGAKPSRAPAGASAQSCPLAIAGIDGLRVTGVGCGTGQKIANEWNRDAGCSSPPGASRFGCTVRGYRCLGTASGRGVAVSCARPQRSIAFIAKRG